VDERRHVFEIEVAAGPEAVWRALTDPDLTERYYFSCRLETTLMPGAPFRYGAAVEGTLLAVEPPRRLEMSARYLFDPRAAAEPPHREAWAVEPLDGGRCRVRLLCDGYDGETTSYRMAPTGLPAMLRGLKNVLEPDRLPPRKERVDEIVVRELTPELRADYLRFFDEDAFRDNPAWAACYCTEMHHGSDDVRGAEANRSYAEQLIRARRMRGFLAYADGRVVGWCNAAPRAALVGLARRPSLAVEDAERVGAITCFVVAAPYRRHGVARALLQAALAGFAEQGLAFAEAYPLKEPSTDAAAYPGPLSLYLAAGFEPYREAGGSVIVRKALARPGPDQP
jgi:uncharacterized protein YndB with AHSA1/START domain/GNAT superfamily N-acetyltransferase